MRDRLRIAIIYDCLYPHTIGGAERWYRSLATLLAKRHDVTYLTRTQWRGEQKPDVPPGVRLVALGGYSHLYNGAGRRRVTPPLSFGINIFFHILRNRLRYDVLHTCSFPYFPMLFASVLARFGGSPVVTDWLEVWPREYWLEYMGKVAGRIGNATQALCIRQTSIAFTFAESTALELKNRGLNRPPVLLRGMLDDDPLLSSKPKTTAASRQPLVIYAGRHIPEKHVKSIPEAIAIAKSEIPELRATIFGDGPDRDDVLREVARLGLSDFVDCPGFVEWDRIDEALEQSMCLLLPSKREGYGLVVLEAAARGTPSIVVDAVNNAAVSFIEKGVNGYVTADASPQALATAIIETYRNTDELTSKTKAWFERNKRQFLIESSLPIIEQTYRDAIAGSRNSNA